MTGALLLALLLGGLIGWERERHARPAGLRTHILVCVGATLLTLISSSFGTNGDRIAAQVVTGVGFLGAGTIIREGASGLVHGLTTAASLWAIAAVGMAVGYGGLYAELGTVATVIILFTLTLLNSFEEDLIRQRRHQALTVVFRPGCVPLDAVVLMLDHLHQRNVKTRDLKMEKVMEAQVAHLQVTLVQGARRDAVDDLLRHNGDVMHYEWGE